MDYWTMFTDLMKRRANLVRQRDEAEVEIAKIKQLIVSVFALLSESQQNANQQAIDDMEAESAGLQDTIKLVFSTHVGEWMTVSNVRDHLNNMGFDFRQYKANPLASIGTTLKRLADTGFIKSTSGGSGMTYIRFKNLPSLNPPEPPNFVPMNTPGAEAARRAMARKPGVDSRPNSAYESGMRGSEEPKK